MKGLGLRACGCTVFSSGLDGSVQKHAGSLQGT